MKLVKFLMKLKNEKVTIELKNGTTLIGFVDSVDIKMNIHLKFVVLQTKGHSDQKLENYSVRGSSIRHVVLPDQLPLEILLQDDTR